jgi:hypothetical protein
MTSPTDITTRVRKAKKAAMGSARKNKVRAVGTTLPMIPLNRPTPNEIKKKQ